MTTASRRRRLCLLLVPAFLAVASAPAVAYGPHTARAEGQPVVGGVTRLTASALPGTTVVGTPQFSWDLDGDGTCETAWSTDPSISVMLPTGKYAGLRNCARDDSGPDVWTCGVDRFVVWPEPTKPKVTLKVPRTTVRQFRDRGIVLTTRWDRPVVADWIATFTADGGTALRVTRVDDRRIRVRLPRGRRSFVPARLDRAFFVKPDLRRDPSWGSVMSSTLNDEFADGTTLDARPVHLLAAPKTPKAR